MTNSPQYSTAPPTPTTDPKSPRRWFKKKRFIIPLVIVVLIIAANASGGGSKSSDVKASATSGSATTHANKQASSDKTTTVTPALYAGRPDIKKGDKELPIGTAVELSGFTTNVQSASFTQKLSTFEEKGYVVADVSILNRDTKAQRYSSADWKIITPQGQIIDATFTSIDGALNSADLASGGNVSGKVVFEVGQTKGDYYIVYDPDFASTSRGIWKAKV